MKWWGWLGVAILALGTGLLIWRATVATPLTLGPDGPPVAAIDRIDRYQAAGSLALLLGAGVLGAALHRPRGTS